ASKFTLAFWKYGISCTEHVGASYFDLHFIALGSNSSDHDRAILSSGAINGGGCRPLYYIYILNILTWNIVEIRFNRNIIDHDQWGIHSHAKCGSLKYSRGVIHN